MKYKLTLAILVLTILEAKARKLVSADAFESPGEFQDEI
jgi:hypothetical protein